MRYHNLNNEEILDGYDKVSRLYPHVPPLSMWRAWEFAAYRHFELVEPVLDVGCGDGRFFRFLWPDVNVVTGVDIDENVVKSAGRSGIYRDVYHAPASAIPLDSGSFASVFANCSIEHMDDLSIVFGEVARVLRAEGTFLMSVVTEKLIEWATLPLVMKAAGVEARAEEIAEDYLSFHHLKNALSVEEWVNHLKATGFDVLDCIPLAPELCGRLFLFLDNLWHLRSGEVEAGDSLKQYFSDLPGFATAFGHVLRGLLAAEKDLSTGCGAVFYTRKRK